MLEFEPCHEKICVGSLTRSDTSQAVQLQSLARGFKVFIQNYRIIILLTKKGSKKNKVADQMCGNAADLRLCFSQMQ